MTRLNLDEQLRKIAQFVYFKPPTNVKMHYPCIRYELDSKDPIYANNQKYIKHNVYKVTAIDTDPESILDAGIEDLPYSEFVTAYESQGLYHFVYKITI